MSSLESVGLSPFSSWLKMFAWLSLVWREFFWWFEQLEEIRNEIWALPSRLSQIQIKTCIKSNSRWPTFFKKTKRISSFSKSNMSVNWTLKLTNIRHFRGWTEPTRSHIKRELNIKRPFLRLRKDGFTKWRQIVWKRIKFRIQKKF